MKIAQVAPYFYPVVGGMENHVYEISKRLSKYYEVVILTSNIDRKGNKLKRVEVIDNLKIKRLKVLFKISEFANFFPEVFKECKNDFDLIHLHGYRHPHNFIPFFTKKPCVITPHYPVYPVSSLKRKILTKSFDALFGKILFKKYRKIIALTKGEKEWISSKFSVKKEKIVVIPNGISKKFLKKHNPNIFLKKYNIPKNRFIILSVGRIHYSKNFQGLIKAISLLPEEVKKDILVVIIGPDAGYLHYLKSLIKKHKLEKQIIFTGRVNENVKLSAYEACDLFVLPSFWEGFGIVILEAMAKNKIVIAKNAGGQKWVVPEKKFLFSSIKELAEKILSVYKGKLKREFDYKEIVKRKYVWENVVKKIKEVYEEVLK